MQNEDFDSVLEHITAMFNQLRRLDEIPAFPGGIQEADHLLEEVGRQLWREQMGPSQNGLSLKGSLFIATEIAMTGGHTAVINDVATNLGERPVGLWLTGYNTRQVKSRSPKAQARTGLADITLNFGDHRGLDCARHMISELRELRPARIFLVHSPADCVAVVVAAAALCMGCSLWLLHVSDTKPCCGIYLDNVRIIDFTPRACAVTRDLLKLPSAWVPLSCPDPGPERYPVFDSEKVRTAVSGSLLKIKRMKNPDYPELVVTILLATGGTHVHVGPTTTRLRRQLERALKRNEIDSDRVVWVPHAPTLVKAFQEQQVTLLLNTYPLGGARTVVEAMAAGVPVVWNSPSEECDLFRLQTGYPEAEVWRDVDSLKQILAKIDGDWLLKQGAAARAWYEKNHHPRLWKEFLQNPEAAFHKPLPRGFDASLMARHIIEHCLERRSTEKQGLFRRMKRVLARQ